MNIGEISVTLKHYAAYYDILRQGLRTALVLEDDAMFESGSKYVDIKLGHGRRAPKKKVLHHFKIDRGFKNHNFRDIFNLEIVPNLPTGRKRLPPDFIEGVVPPGVCNEKKRKKRKKGKKKRCRGEPYNFDFLMLAACDSLAIRMEALWEEGSTYGGGNWNIESWESNEHLLSAARSCSRCMIAYVVSMQGAVKVLTNPRGFCRGVDYNIGLMSKEAPVNGTFNCLHVFPNIAWEDPGIEGDSNFVQRNPLFEGNKDRVGARQNGTSCRNTAIKRFGDIAANTSLLWRLWKRLFPPSHLPAS